MSNLEEKLERTRRILKKEDSAYWEPLKLVLTNLENYKYI